LIYRFLQQRFKSYLESRTRKEVENGLFFLSELFKTLLGLMSTLIGTLNSVEKTTSVTAGSQVSVPHWQEITLWRGWWRNILPTFLQETRKAATGTILQQPSNSHKQNSLSFA